MINFRRPLLRLGRVLTTLAGLGLAWTVSAGDAIRFSKPAIAIAAPPKVESHLPEIRERERGLDFSDQNFEQAPAAPFRPSPPPMMRNDPRNDEQDGTHRLLRTPKMFTDPDEEKARKEARREARDNPFAPKAESQRAPSPFMKDMATQMRSDQSRSLSPVTDLDWQPGDPAGGRKESRRDGPDAASPYARREDAPFGPESGRAAPLIDFSGGRPQEKLTPSQMQRRTDFEQLLNPNAGPAGKGPNSLQPVVNAADAKSATPAIPTVGGSGFDPRSADPMHSLNQQRDRLRGPVIDDINKRYNPPSAPGSGSPYDTGNNAQKSRPPLTREFPTRKF